MVAASPARRTPLASLAAALAVTGVDAALLALSLGGAPALLAHPRALTLLGVWAAANSTLALLRPVRQQEPVVLGPRERLVMVALLLLPLAAAPLGALGERAGVLLRPGGDALGWAGIAFAALGLSLRIAAMVRLGRRFSPQVVVQSDHALETGGPYALIRHPGYLGSMIAALGAGLAFRSALGLVPALLMIPALSARIRHEEALMEAHFGIAWRDYRSRTGTLWPRVGTGAAAPRR